FASDCSVADGIDAPKPALETAGSNPVLDLLAAEADAQELPSSDDAVLPAGEHGQRRLEVLRCGFRADTGVNPHRAGCAPLPSRKALRRTGALQAQPGRGGTRGSP